MSDIVMVKSFINKYIKHSGAKLTKSEKKLEDVHGNKEIVVTATYKNPDTGKEFVIRYFTEDNQYLILADKGRFTLKDGNDSNDGSIHLSMDDDTSNLGNFLGFDFSNVDLASDLSAQFINNDITLKEFFNRFKDDPGNDSANYLTREEMDANHKALNAPWPTFLRILENIFS